ncbi:MAG TPA: (d)CMP kinase [Actinomycetota bacterium]|nr:(d)CMP kinase [Actinomycetota bacterium]
MIAIAIDGPAGAGKTTVARRVAEQLGWQYLDTGAMYRAVALSALTEDIDPTDEQAVTRLAGELDISMDGNTVLVGERDVTEALRRPQVTVTSSIVSKHPGVRAVMVDHQRRVAADGPVVVEGRDIGTVVLPHAPVKIFLTANLDERAARRAEELELQRSEDSERLKKAIATRDRADQNRTVSPLVQAEDAVLIDSTGRSVDEIVDEIISLVRSAGLPG